MPSTLIILTYKRYQALASALNFIGRIREADRGIRQLCMMLLLAKYLREELSKTLNVAVFEMNLRVNSFEYDENRSDVEVLVLLEDGYNLEDGTEHITGAIERVLKNTNIGNTQTFHIQVCRISAQTEVKLDW